MSSSFVFLIFSSMTSTSEAGLQSGMSTYSSGAVQSAPCRASFIMSVILSGLVVNAKPTPHYLNHHS
ncbi:MAG: hypothetical protein L0956_04020, partial [Candidatus Mariimomonas ferrooxydans]